MRTDTYEVSPVAKTFSRASAGKSLRPLWKASTPEYSGSEIRFSLYLSGSLGCSSGCQLGIRRGCRETGSLGQQRVGSPQEEQQRRTRLQRLQLCTHGKAEREQVIAAKLATHLRYECFSTSITCSIGSVGSGSGCSTVQVLCHFWVDQMRDVPRYRVVIGASRFFKIRANGPHSCGKRCPFADAQPSEPHVSNYPRQASVTVADQAAGRGANGSPPSSQSVRSSLHLQPRAVAGPSIQPVQACPRQHHPKTRS